MTVASQDLYQRLLKSIQEGVDLRPRMVNVGTVIAVGDGVARIQAWSRSLPQNYSSFHPKPVVLSLSLGLRLTLSLSRSQQLFLVITS